MGQLSGIHKTSPPVRHSKIAVIGASTAPPSTLEIAFDVGAALAREGWHLLCGGGGGVMAAACEGFVSEPRSSGQLAIGILPTDEDPWANPYVELTLPTGLGLARNAVITRAADAVVAIGGCSGTLSEMAYAWQMKRPLVAMVNAGGWAATLAGQAIDDRRDDAVFPAKSTAEAVSFLRSALEEK